jgi:hypothetical protein
MDALQKLYFCYFSLPKEIKKLKQALFSYNEGENQFEADFKHQIARQIDLRLELLNYFFKHFAVSAGILIFYNLVLIYKINTVSYGMVPLFYLFYERYFKAMYAVGRIFAVYWIAKKH